MRQKTFFCNNCSEIIEPTDKSWGDGGRYCDVCRHDFPGRAYGSKILAFVALIIGLFGIGSLWRAEKPLNAAAKQIAVIQSNQTKSATNQTPPASSNSNAPPSAQKSDLSPDAAIVIAPTPPKKPQNAAVSPEEMSYACGAPTKKGTSCTRRVRGGGHCWQHKGQTTSLTAEKLPVSR